METLRFNTACINCIYHKFMQSVPEGTDEPTKLRYAKQILRIIADADNMTGAPEIVATCTAYKNETFGESDDFAEMKTYFNQLMLGYEGDIEAKIRASEDSLRAAICYALLGNYIDFGAMDHVDESKLRSMMEKAEDFPIDEKELTGLRGDLAEAKRLVFLTDNCGEIVFDKLLIEELHRQYPALHITVIVRGENVLNDATLYDAEQVGLTALVPVIGNGTGIAGTCVDRLPEDVRKTVLDADVILAKGQGNFETLCYSHLNIYYIFMCKCAMFANRFHVESLSPMLINDLRMAL